MSNGFEKITTGAAPQIQDLARRAKALVEEIMPDVVEVTWPNQSIISFFIYNLLNQIQLLLKCLFIRDVSPV